MLEVTSSIVDAAGSIAIPIAHGIGVPHTDPVPAPADHGGGGVSTIVILLGIGFTLVLVAALVWARATNGADI